MPTWNERLRQARKQTKLTRPTLAALAGLSVDTVASYEYGRRSPQRDRLLALTRAMKLDGAATNAILREAGLEPEASPWLKNAVLLHRPEAELQAELTSYAWPSLALNERFEITAWNQPAGRLAELDFGTALPEPHQRNLLRIAAMQHIRQRLVNWTEVVAVMVGMYKGHHMGSEELGEGSPYFQTVVNDILQHDADAMPALLGLWQSTPPRPPQCRDVWAVRWRAGDGSLLRFDCLLTDWDEFDAIGLNDWHPADAATWAWFEQHR